MLEYVSDSVVIKTIIGRATGSVSAISFDSGKILTGPVSPFDIFIQIIDGQAEIVIDNQSNWLETGQCIIIPAHVRNVIKSSGRCKIVSTVIKSGYEDIDNDCI